MVHITPTKVLLTTTLRPLVMQLSGALAQGIRLLDQCLHKEPTPLCPVTGNNQAECLRYM